MNKSGKMTGVAIISLLAVSIFYGVLLYAKDEPEAPTPPEVQAAVSSNVVRHLRDCADLLSVRDRIEGRSGAGERIHNLFPQWLSFPNIMRAHKRSDGVMTQVAETMAMFRPQTVAKEGKLIDKFSKHEDLCFMIILLDRCYRNRGWSSVLKSAVGSKEIALIEGLLEEAHSKGQNPDAELKVIREELPESLNDHATEKMAVNLLLKKKPQNHRELAETLAALLDTSEHRYETLRWLTLSGTEVPKSIKKRIKDIATRIELGAGPRCPAIRALGLIGESVDFFPRLQSDSAWYPVSDVSRRSGLVQYYFHVVKQARVAYEFRKTPRADRINYLVRTRIEAPHPLLTHLACAFYPIETVQNTLRRLEQGKEIPPLGHSMARSIIESGLMTEDLANSLITALKRLPKKDINPVMAFMAGTGDFNRFGLPLIKEYRKLEEDEGPNYVQKDRTAAYIMALINVRDGDTDVIAFLERLPNEEGYREYASTIASIIKRIRRFENINRRRRRDK